LRNCPLRILVSTKYDGGNFDIVITDIRMPGLDGIGVVEHIRNSNRNLTPIIGISGTPWKLQDKLFDATLHKPFNLKDLLDTIETLSNEYLPSAAGLHAQ